LYHIKSDADILEVEENDEFDMDNDYVIPILFYSILFDMIKLITQF